MKKGFRSLLYIGFIAALSYMGIRYLSPDINLTSKTSSDNIGSKVAASKVSEHYAPSHDCIILEDGVEYGVAGCEPFEVAVTFSPIISDFYQRTKYAPLFVLSPDSDFKACKNGENLLVALIHDDVGRVSDELSKNLNLREFGCDLYESSKMLAANSSCCKDPLLP